MNDAKPHVSGVYTFELEELSADQPVALKPDGADARLVAKFTTEAADWRAGVGANGLAITPKGILYVCNFGEASILTAPLKDDGFLANPLEVLVKGKGLRSTDGMKYVAEWDKLVVADFFRKRSAHRKYDRWQGAHGCPQPEFDRRERKTRQTVRTLRPRDNDLHLEY